MDSPEIYPTSTNIAIVLFSTFYTNISKRRTEEKWTDAAIGCISQFKKYQKKSRQILLMGIKLSKNQGQFYQWELITQIATCLLHIFASLFIAEVCILQYRRKSAKDWVKLILMWRETLSEMDLNLYLVFHWIESRYKVCFNFNWTKFGRGEKAVETFTFDANHTEEQDGIKLFLLLGKTQQM